MRKINDILRKILAFFWITYVRAILLTVLSATTVILYGGKIWRTLNALWQEKIQVPQTEIKVSTLIMIVLASLIVLALIVYLGYKIIRARKNKVRYIDFNKFIWKVQRNNDRYNFEPFCVRDYIALNHINIDELFSQYCYRCEQCGEEYSTDLVDGEQQALESAITNFGIKHFKNRFVNIKRKVKPLKARSK